MSSFSFRILFALAFVGLLILALAHRDDIKPQIAQVFVLAHTQASDKSGIISYYIIAKDGQHMCSPIAWATMKDEHGYKVTEIVDQYDSSDADKYIKSVVQ